MLWFIFYKSELLLKCEADGTFTIPQGPISPIETNSEIFVHNVSPMTDETEVRTFSVDSSQINRNDLCFCSLRESFYKISLPLYLKAGKCSEILHWDKNSKYCGLCGAPMKLYTDISKRCTSCENEIWPNLAIAVIILIYRDDEILLVKSRNFKGSYYGLVAGFVETGESVEEAAIREIREEVGICVKHLEYTMSQPWPYPSGLMIGFKAEYEKGEIQLQISELIDGGWYKIDKLPELPGKMGIARKMVDSWVSDKLKTKN